MWRGSLVPAPTFLGAVPYEHARVGLFGAPLDVTSSFRPGSRFGPAAIRQASAGIEDWSLDAGEGLEAHPFADLGDLDLAPGEVDGSLQTIRATAAGILSDGRVPLALGGEHLVTLPLVEAAAARHPDLVLVQLDAHADLREEYMGLRLSHATVVRRVAEMLGAGRVHQFGIRSATAGEAAFARTATRLHGGDPAAALRAARSELAASPLYLTVDVDVADPAFAPGTGTPEPGGISSSALLQALAGLRGLRIAAADVVEVAPAYDAGGITALLAAKVVREVLIAIA